MSALTREPKIPDVVWIKFTWHHGSLIQENMWDFEPFDPEDINRLGVFKFVREIYSE